MSKTVDLELKKAFAELHQKTVETTKKVQIADMQIESLKKSKQLAELTTVEIKSLPDNTTTYESVGRMFMLTPVPTVLENLSKKTASCSEKIKTLEDNKSFLEKSMKETEEHCRELVKQRKFQPEK
ncbi:prefoldin subunit [Nesidiocoris tenuis]|uniref:Prefoldin subunit n=1 Tax=Nesidiocoris tenuis TaxID=355587 RepID=A0ABN7A8K1_9HEMI|nr:prefoldin subunit [Nesidiocoris tenuis]